MSDPPPIFPPGPTRRIPLYWWPFWMLLLAGALFIFYGLLTPVWIGIRAVARVSERRALRSRPVQKD